MNLEVRILELKELVSECKNTNQLTQLIKSDEKIKRLITTLYFDIFNKQLSGCNNCIADGVFLILNNKKMEQSKFQLRAGEVIYDPSPKKDSANTLTQKNISDELAIYHIAENPKCLPLFTKFPANTQQLVDAYINKKYADNIEAKEKALSVVKEVFGEPTISDSEAILGLKNELDKERENKALSDEKITELELAIVGIIKESDSLKANYGALLANNKELGEQYDLLLTEKENWQQEKAELESKMSILSASVFEEKISGKPEQKTPPKTPKK